MTEAEKLSKSPVSKKRKTLSPKPRWLKVQAPAGERFHHLKDLFKELNLATVCQEARCPNIGECWKGGTATIMLMGEVCTRGCRFCHVKSGNPAGLIDQQEPEKVGFALGQMGLDYVVLTSVDRDDIPDQGASHFGRTVEIIKENDPNLIVEVLTPDFQGKREFIDRIIQAKPEVIAQNVETVERLTKKVRDRRAGYWQTLGYLEYVKQQDPTRYTKTSIMLGLGETDVEVRQTLKDLRSAGCDVVTFGQYLQPSFKQLPVERFYSPEEFAAWQEEAESMGFLYVASGPLVRSSYKAGEFFMKGVIDKKRQQENEVK